MDSKPLINKEPALSSTPPETELTVKERLFLLSRVPLFSALKSETIDLILSRCPIVAVKAGNFFFRENERGDGMFVLEKGRVAIIRMREGKEYLLAELGEGDCFGEMEMLDLMPRSASVRAESDCRAVHAHYTVFHELFKKDPGEFGLLMMNLARELSRRLMSADGKLTPSTPVTPGS